MKRHGSVSEPRPLGNVPDRPLVAVDGSETLPPQPSVAEEAMFETFATEFARQHEASPVTAVNRILLPTDFSPCSLHALRYAGEIARRFGAELIMLHVDFARSMYDLPDASEPMGRHALERAMELMRRHGLRVRGMCHFGLPAEEIVRTAAAEHADMIVMGTHGRTGLRHALLGSVAETVVRKASCPVMTVRAPARE